MGSTKKKSTAKKTTKKVAKRTAKKATKKVASKPAKKAAKKQAPKLAKPRLTSKQVLAELKRNGSAQTVKIYRNHGVTGDFWGVSYAFLKKLHKQVKVDHDLALELWETGNHDARVFACWVADEDCTTMKQLSGWAKAVDNHVLAHEVASLAQDCDFAGKLADKWIARKDEWHTTLGWSVYARLATQVVRPPSEGGVDDTRIKELVALIVATVHKMPNRTRHAMNGALISIGCRSQAWRKRAHAAAKKIGKLEVDYGATSCKVNDASAYIEKSWTRYEKKGQEPSDGTAGQRRRHC